MWWLIATAAAGWRVDTTSLAIRHGAGAPTTACTQDGVLGVAAVVYSRKQGTMAWGHASLRAVSCHDGVRIDREYESYRLSGWNEAQLAHEHADEPFLQDTEWLRAQRGALVLFRNEDPVSGGWYADAQAKNREVYEVWLDLPPAELEAVVAQVELAYAEQRTRLRNREALPQRYRALSENCTWVFSAFLPARLTSHPPHLPFAWLRRLEPHAASRVLHPSHHLIRRWEDGVPEVVERPRPVLRPKKNLPSGVGEALARGSLGPGPLASAPRAPPAGRPASPPAR